MDRLRLSELETMGPVGGRGRLGGEGVTNLDNFTGLTGNTKTIHLLF